MIKGSEAIRRLTENESTSITIDNIDQAKMEIIQ